MRFASTVAVLTALATPWGLSFLHRENEKPVPHHAQITLPVDAIAAQVASVPEAEWVRVELPRDASFEADTDEMIEADKAISPAAMAGWWGREITFDTGSRYLCAMNWYGVIGLHVGANDESQTAFIPDARGQIHYLHQWKGGQEYSGIVNPSQKTVGIEPTREDQIRMLINEGTDDCAHLLVATHQDQAKMEFTSITPAQEPALIARLRKEMTNPDNRIALSQQDITTRILGPAPDADEDPTAPMTPRLMPVEHYPPR